MKEKLVEIWLWFVAILVTIIMVSATFLWVGALVLFITGRMAE